MDTLTFPKAVTDRGLNYFFKKLSMDDIATRLFKVSENYPELPDSFFTDTLIAIAEASDGSLRHGMRLLERCIYGKIYTIDSLVNDMGILPNFEIKRNLKMILGGDFSVISCLVSMDANSFWRLGRKLLFESLSQVVVSSTSDIFGTVDKNKFFRLCEQFFRYTDYSFNSHDFIFSLVKIVDENSVKAVVRRRLA
jgi:hypothetical protein